MTAGVVVDVELADDQEVRARIRYLGSLGGWHTFTAGQHAALHLGGVEHDHPAPAGSMAAEFERLRDLATEVTAPARRQLEEFVAAIARAVRR